MEKSLAHPPTEIPGGNEKVHEKKSKLKAVILEHVNSAFSCLDFDFFASLNTLLFVVDVAESSCRGYVKGQMCCVSIIGIFPISLFFVLFSVYQTQQELWDALKNMGQSVQFHSRYVV